MPSKKISKNTAVRYDPHTIEPKWQKHWLKTEAFKTPKNARNKKYVLDMFPYPSGAGLHIGHVESYTASDIVARFNRMNGHDVLHPMGWDAFGLPAENYALKTGIHPAITTKKNIDTFRAQLQRLGFSYDWSREVNTTDPEYYQWTQWIFLQLFKQGLAYEAEVAINWCPSCKTGLANEEVVAGECDRCGTIVGKKNLRQWLLRITKYAEPLLRDLDELDWPDRIKEQQRNWIGRSEGAEVTFDVVSEKKSLTIFTTRPDTLFGATYLVLAPEHALVDRLVTAEQRANVQKYVRDAKSKSDLERTAAKKKTGVATGMFAVNPVNSEKIPIWVADYVLSHYGTGAIMAVPAHDQRDHEFATALNLPIRVVIEPDAAGTPTVGSMDQKSADAFVGEGRLVESGEYSGMQSTEASKKITSWLTKNKKGRATVHYKLRDWVFSRQRYWGEPIPIIHCPKHGAVPVPEEQLPVQLPPVKKFEPTGTGESPLAAIADWVNTRCPIGNEPAKRETNTMPQWAGSSWYFLRFIDPHNKKEAWAKTEEKKWLPVDFYIGGAEHAVLHLLYARFWVKALKDAGHLSFDEPFLSLRNQGIILGEDSQKMSKSRGNVVNPDDLIKIHGADALRLFEMFLGPIEQEKSWNTKGIAGIDRFLERVWRLKENLSDKKLSGEFAITLEKTTKIVSDDIAELKFNTAISSLMQLINVFGDEIAGGNAVPHVAYERLLLLLAPMAPFITEELWSVLGHKDSIHSQPWPEAEKKLLTQSKVMVVVQVDGRFRGKIELAVGTSEPATVAAAKKIPAVTRAIADKKIVKQVFVQDRVLNLLTG